jgi:hypothetical protein
MLSKFIAMQAPAVPNVVAAPLQEGEWLSLLWNMVNETKIFWTAQTWRKKLPSGVEKIAHYMGAYYGLKTLTSDMKLELGYQPLVGNANLLKECIKKILIEKSNFSGASKQTDNAYSILDNDAKSVSISFTGKRGDMTARFYAAANQLLMDDAESQQAAKKELLALREQVITKVRSVHFSAEEKLFFESVVKMLNAFEQHFKHGGDFTLCAVHLFRENPSLLSDVCKAQMHTLTEKILLVQAAANKQDNYKEWFNRFHIVYLYSMGQVTSVPKIHNEDIQKLNNVPYAINEWLDSKKPVSDPAPSKMLKR